MQALISDPLHSERQLDRERGGLGVAPKPETRFRAYFPHIPPVRSIQSGLNMSPDYPLILPKESRIGLRFRISSNRAYFQKRTN